MKIYKVKVNGKVYEVELESVTESNAKIAAAPASAPAAPVSGDGQAIVAPMQGTILNVKVNVGDTVKKGQVVAILEAMKLENEIVSPFDGTVKQVIATKGQKVNNQDKLVIIG